VKTVLELLNMDVSELIKADSRAAIIIPRMPIGRVLRTRSGYAMSVQPARLPQIASHLSGSAQATLSTSSNNY